uniref:Nephrin n=1 Tax=Parastrongyloides trichosuri TaxID=131310 RepID=A0A0N4ZBA7_PARTI
MKLAIMPQPYHKSVFILLIFLSITYSQYNIIQEYPQNVSILIGSDVTFKCSAIPDPRIHFTQIQWKDNSDFLLGTQTPGVLPGHEGRYSYIRNSRDELNLNIRKVTLSDDGTFECQLIRPGTKPQKAPAILEVLVPPTDVYFVNYASGTTLDIREGTNLNITCASSFAKPKADIRWYVNGQSFETEDVQLWYEKNDNKTISSFSSIVWRPLREDAHKIITCEGRHEKTNIKKRVNVTINVLYPPEKPHIIFRSNSGNKDAIRAGDKISLLCIVKGGNPKPIVSWYSNGIKIESEYEYNESTKETQSIYSFTAEAVDNEAMYECRASNGIGLEYSSHKIELSVMYKPLKVELLGKGAIKPGEQLPLQCISRKSNPPAVITFQVNGKEVQSDSSISGNLVGNSQGTVSNISLNYDDVFNTNGEIIVKCFARNVMGIAEEQQMIRILSPPSKPEIFGINEHHFNEGDYLNLTCESTGGNPLASLSWHRGIEKLNGSQTLIAGDISQSVISLKVDRTMNRRPIRCEAENEALSTPYEVSKTLHVVYPPRHLNIRVADPSRNYVRAGEASYLICTSILSNPAPHITWEINLPKDSQPKVMHGEYMKRNESDFGDWFIENRLTFIPTEEMNGLSVQCIASHSNWKEPVVSKYTLNVYYPPKINYYQDKISLQVKEGEDFRENLTIIANPPVSSWLWKKGGVPFAGRVGGIYAHGNTISGQKISKKDSGVYTLIASNIVGNANTTVILTVQYPARIAHLTSPIYANDGESVVFECEAEGEPRTDEMIKWYRNDKVVGSMMREQKRAVLRLNASEESDGKYTCVTDNGIGKPHSQDAYLLVKRAPVAFKDDVAKRAAADVGSTAHIKCKTTAVPFAYFKWNIEGDRRPINDNSTKYSFYDRQVDFVTFESTLYIQHVDESDYKRKITCIVANQMGEDKVEISLGPLTVPDIPKGVNLMDVTNDSLTIGWIPGFDGGTEQHYEVRYQNIATKESYTLNTSSTSINLSNLQPLQGYQFQVRSHNKHGAVSDYSSSKIFHTTSYDGMMNEIKPYSFSIAEVPKWIIIAVIFAVIFCLFINLILICRHKRNDAKKKIEEKTKMMRNLQSADGGIVNGIQKYGTMTPCTIRRPLEGRNPSSQEILQDMGSEDETSVRTMIEIPQHGGNYVHVSQPNYIDDHVMVQYDIDSAVYADIMRRNSPAILSHVPQSQYDADFDASVQRIMTPSYVPLSIYGNNGEMTNLANNQMATESYRDIKRAFESPSQIRRNYHQHSTLPHDTNTYRSQGTIPVDEYQSYQYNSGTLNNNRRYVPRSPQVLSTFSQPLTATTSVMGTDFSVSDGDLV